MRIAVDAMGGDLAPVPIIRGSLIAAEGLPSDQIVLVGDEPILRAAIAEQKLDADRLSILHAPDTITMDDHPVEALRAKPASSIAVAIGQLAAGKADAMVSAGNTGATVAAASLTLRTLAGVKRPGIAVSIPAKEGQVTLIDAGANLSCRPGHLQQYAIMASHFVNRAFGIENPRVGLLNVGEEASKGTELVQATHKLLKETKINYIGSVEAHDLPNRPCDVLVADGFAGNCVLKACEGYGRSVLDQVATVLKKRLPEALYNESMAALAPAGDYSVYGGAPLLGVNGVVVIAHGRSDDRAIAGAIRLAARLKESAVNDAIARDLSSFSDAAM